MLHLITEFQFQLPKRSAVTPVLLYVYLYRNLCLFIYIQTYFCSEEEVKKYVRDIEEEDITEFSTEKLRQRIQLLFKKPLNVSVEEFIIGMWELLSVVPEVEEFVLENIYNNAELYSDVQGVGVFDVLAQIGGIGIPNSKNIGEFKDTWHRASKKYFNQRDEFVKNIDETISSALTSSLLFQSNVKKFREDGFQHYLNIKDKEYISDLDELFKDLYSYNDSEQIEFHYKSDKLRKANNKTRELIDQDSKDSVDFFLRLKRTPGIDKDLSDLVSTIDEFPDLVNFTYLQEKTHPMLYGLLEKIQEESSNLYGAKPEITVKTGKAVCLPGEDNVIKVPVTFQNKVNVQYAENVSVKIVPDNDEVDVTENGQFELGVLQGNGEEKEKLVSFKVAPKIKKSRSFTVNVIIAYRHSINMDEYEDTSVTRTLDINFDSPVFKHIENKFKKFARQQVVDDNNMFFGRDEFINEIIGQISGEGIRGKCIALYGQTRAGKSSILHHLAEKLREIDKEKHVIINTGSFGDVGYDIGNFLYTLLDVLKTEIELYHPQLEKILRERGIVIDPDKLGNDPEHAQRYFNSTFRKIKSCVESGSNKYNIIVMIDEFTYIYDWIRKGVMTDRVMKFWKAFIQNYGFNAVLIGQDHMPKFVNDERFTNDFGSTDLRRVSYLDEKYAKALMRDPVELNDETGEREERYQPEALNRLYELTAGSAFLIMILCAGLVDYVNERRIIYITKSHINTFINTKLHLLLKESDFEPQYTDRYSPSEDERKKTTEKNRKMFEKIALSSRYSGWVSLENVCKTDEDKKIIRDLAERDALIINGGRCKIKVELYKEWLIEKAKKFGEL